MKRARATPTAPARKAGPARRVERRSRIEPTPRVMQVRGLFDVQPSDESVVTWDVNVELPAEWHIGLIVGPSGSGKTTIAGELFGDALAPLYSWPPKRSVLDGFPAGLSIGDITTLLARVGFASPPSWLRPFAVLSNGEQFRATLARALAEPRELVVMDEFTSVVDRTVAQVGSHCVAKLVRAGQAKVKRFVAVSCHYDIIDWLQPDWMYEPGVDRLTRRELQRRPNLKLEISPVDYAAWRLFAPHHYLTRELHRAARCFVGFLDGAPAVFDGVLSLPSGSLHNAWRSSRRVTLPDFQGLGLGPIMGDQIGSAYRACGYRYFENPTHPSLIRARQQDAKWRMIRAPQFSASGGDRRHFDLVRTRATDRWVASFEYVGPPMADRALAFGLTGRPQATMRRLSSLRA